MLPGELCLLPCPSFGSSGIVVHVEFNCPVHVLWSRGGTGCLCAVLFRWEPSLCCDLGGGLGISVFLVGVLMQLSAGKKFMFSAPPFPVCAFWGTLRCWSRSSALGPHTHPSNSEWHRHLCEGVAGAGAFLGEEGNKGRKNGKERRERTEEETCTNNGSLYK